MTEDEKIDQDKTRYDRAAHRVQTALAAMPGDSRMTVKHMRTAIDLSKSDQCGLATLLISKGVFTFAEYVDAMASAAEDEADRYEAELSEKFGVNITTL